MRIIKDVLRLKFEANLSRRQIARSLNIGLGTVSLHLNRAKVSTLSWPLPEGLDDNGLVPNQLAPVRGGMIEPEYVTIHKELKRKGVTKQLLWEEYRQTHGDSCYPYPQYYQRYRDWVLKTAKIGCSGCAPIPRRKRLSEKQCSICATSSQAGAHASANLYSLIEGS
ncbi:MAG: hypothetical protein ACJAUP_001318 [Cellvibrionaceae bacterium]|jgi:hypothetical protein